MKHFQKQITLYSSLRNVRQEKNFQQYQGLMQKEKVDINGEDDP